MVFNMHNIVLAGLSHKTASVELRECVSFTQKEIEKALKILKKKKEIKEAVLFSTCNRFEAVLFADSNLDIITFFKNFVSNLKKIKINKFEQAIYYYKNKEAVRHLFRVASSLDSMIIGEPQILGQIKEAYKIAVSEKTSGTVLNKLLHKTFFVAKRVRTETNIGNNAVSISYAAIELGKKIFGSLKNRRILMIGAGEMAELALEHLFRKKTKEIYIANRTFENAVFLANRFLGKPINFDEIISYLNKVEIVISSTSSEGLVLKRNHIKNIMKIRKNNSLFFIDIAVPRDIDPKINNIENAYVYDIDDLKEIVNENKEERVKESLKAERIIDEALINFKKWYNSLDIVPTIIAMRKKIELISNKELKKTFNSLKHISKSDKDSIKIMLNSILKKILHDPTLFLKKTNDHNNKILYLNFAKNLFNL